MASKIIDRCDIQMIPSDIRFYMELSLYILNLTQLSEFLCRFRSQAKMVRSLIIRLFILLFMNIVVQLVEFLQHEHEYLSFDSRKEEPLGNVLFMFDLVLYYVTIMHVFQILFRFKRVEVAMNL